MNGKYHVVIHDDFEGMAGLGQMLPVFYRLAGLGKVSFEQPSENPAADAGG